MIFEFIIEERGASTGKINIRLVFFYEQIKNYDLRIYQMRT
jgi:hypothetical protein